MRASSRLLGVSLSLLFVGCGGNVTVEGTGGAGGAGGAPVTSVSAGGSGGAIQQCGGKQGLQCDADAWCDYQSNTTCGCCDMIGTCVAKPLDCPLDCPGACGCDGNFYCNGCLANLAGVDVEPLATCGPMNVDYSVHVLPTDAPRFVIFKSDAFRDICVRVMVVGFGEMAPFKLSVTPPWQIESIVVTNHAADCTVELGGFPEPPLNQSVDAIGADGKIEIDLPDLPCGVTADATLYFDSTAPWIPDIEPFNSGYLSTNIPCDL
jgi:hypothetical protein